MSDTQDDHRVMMAARSLLGKVLLADARPMVDGEVVTVRLDDLAALRDLLRGVAGDWRPVLPSAVPTTIKPSTLVIPEPRPGIHGPEAAARNAARLHEEHAIRVERSDVAATAPDRVPPNLLQSAQVCALLRRLCQLNDAGGESMRTARARHAEAAWSRLHRELPEYEREYAKCDADPVGYLEAAEHGRLEGDRQRSVAEWLADPDAPAV